MMIVTLLMMMMVVGVMGSWRMGSKAFISHPLRHNDEGGKNVSTLRVKFYGWKGRRRSSPKPFKSDVKKVIKFHLFFSTLRLPKKCFLEKPFLTPFVPWYMELTKCVHLGFSFPSSRMTVFHASSAQFFMFFFPLSSGLFLLHLFPNPFLCEIEWRGLCREEVC